MKKNEIVECVEKIAEKIRETVAESSDVFDVYITPATKNNSVVRNMVCIRKEGTETSAAFCVDEMADKVLKGEKTVADAAEEILSIFFEQYPPKDLTLDNVMNKEFILGHVVYQLINKKANTELLMTVPYKDVLDLAAVYKVVISNDDSGQRSFLLKYDMLRKLDISISVDELDAAAYKNTENIGFTCSSIFQTLDTLVGGSDMPDLGADDLALYVLTRKDHMFGAAVLLYPEIIAKLADKLEDDLLIIPSSIHEVLAYPGTHSDPITLHEMCSEINADMVKPEEILGDTIYRYCRETRQLMIA